MAVIYGPDGRPIRSSKNKPILNEIAVVSVRDRWSTYPSQGLTPDKLASIFREADDGDVYRQMELFEELEEKDPHLGSELGKRKQAVLGLDWEIVPYSDAPEDKKAAQLVQDAMELEGWEDSLLDILDATGKGYSGSEILWVIKDGLALPQSIKWVHPKRFTFGDKDELRLLTTSEPVSGIELPGNKFIIHKFKARSGHPARAGIIRVCAWMYLFKNYGVKDWVTFAEVYGMPLRLGKYDSSTSKEDKDALVQAIIQLGTDAAGIISKSTEIEFVEAMKGSKDNVFETLANFCNREMSKAILGQTLSAEAGDRGSYSLGKVHNEVRHDLTKSDAKALAETLRRALFKPIVRFNLGDKPNLPWMKFKLMDPGDQLKSAKIYSVLIKDCGLPVSAKHVYEKFDIPAPAAGEELLMPQEPAAPGSAGLPMKALKETPPTDPQADIDALADRAGEQALAALGRMIEPVRQLIAQGGSLEEIREQLPRLYNQMDEGEFEQLVAQSMFIADRYGRYTAGGN